MSDIGTKVFRKLEFRLMEGASKSLTKKNDGKSKCSLLAGLLCLLITKVNAFCTEKTYLPATAGRLVVLPPVVAKTEEVSFILWIRDEATEIATIRYREESAFIQYNGNGDKVNISQDGSLTINNFTVEDQGTYTVMIKQLNQSACNHTFYVSISDKSPCGDIRDVAGREEEEITLPLDADGVQIKIVYWLSHRGELLAKTKPGGYIQAQGNYDRRVQTLADSSLTIMKLTVEDQGIYVANVYMYSGKRCSQKYNITISGVITETANTKAVYVYSTEEQEVTLPFPEHLMDQVENVFWMKDFAKHIATTFMNGSLHVLDSRYLGRLNSTSYGSLIIFDLRVEDRGKYSADIHLINKELYTEIYHLSIYRKSYHISLGTRTMNVTEGGDFIFQNGIQEIQSIDWLTPRWIRFAVTNLDGVICIYNQSYSDRLSSLSDGSLTIKRVTKKDEGIYRAHMFLHNGTLLELQYRTFIQISEHQTIIVLCLSVTTGILLIFAILLIIYPLMMKKKRTEKFNEKEILKMKVYEDPECSFLRFHTVVLGNTEKDSQGLPNYPEWRDKFDPNQDIRDGDLVGNTNWCSCQNCITMATQDTSVCCRELGELNDLFDEGMTCILQKSELTSIKFDEQELVWLIAFSRRIPQCILAEHRNRCLRKACYWSFMHFVYDHLGPTYPIPVPSCVLNYVRKRYPIPPEESVGCYWSNEYDELDMTPDKDDIMYTGWLLHHHELEYS